MRIPSLAQNLNDLYASQLSKNLTLAVTVLQYMSIHKINGSCTPNFPCRTNIGDRYCYPISRPITVIQHFLGYQAAYEGMLLRLQQKTRSSSTIDINGYPIIDPRSYFGIRSTKIQKSSKRNWLIHIHSLLLSVVGLAHRMTSENKCTGSMFIHYQSQ